MQQCSDRDGRGNGGGGGKLRSPYVLRSFIYSISVGSAQNLQSLTPTALATKLTWAKMLNNLEWVLGIDNRVTRKAVRRIVFILACRTPQFIMMRGRIWLATEACPRPNEVIKYTPRCWGSALPFFSSGSTVLWENAFFPPHSVFFCS